MPKYRTRDHTVFYKRKPIPAFTEVDVPEEDAPLWEKLVEQHYADPVGEEAEEKEPAPEEEEKEPAPEEEKKPARKRKRS